MVSVAVAECSGLNTHLRAPPSLIFLRGGSGIGRGYCPTVPSRGWGQALWGIERKRSDGHLLSQGAFSLGLGHGCGTAPTLNLPEKTSSTTSTSGAVAMGHEGTGGWQVSRETSASTLGADMTTKNPLKPGKTTARLRTKKFVGLDGARKFSCQLVGTTGGNCTQGSKVSGSTSL